MADRVRGAFAPERPLIGFFDRLARPLLRALDPEDAHSLAIKALKFAPRRRPRPDDSRLAVRAFGLNFPNPVGMAPGFDKHAEVPDALLRPGLRLCRDRHGDAAAAARQSAPAAVSPRAGRGRDQPARLQQRGRGRGAGAARGARRRGRHRRRQYRRQQGFQRPHRRLRPPDRAVRAGGELRHRQHLVAQHAGPARPAARVRGRRSAGARRRGPRPGRAARGADAGAAQDRARSVACRSRRHRRRGARAQDRRHDRRQHHDRPAAGAARPGDGASRPAGCRAGRSIRWRRGCWRRPMCGSKARFR